MNAAVKLATPRNMQNDGTFSQTRKPAHTNTTHQHTEPVRSTIVQRILGPEWASQPATLCVASPRALAPAELLAALLVAPVHRALHPIMHLVVLRARAHGRTLCGPRVMACQQRRELAVWPSTAASDTGRLARIRSARLLVWRLRRHPRVTRVTRGCRHRGAEDAQNIASNETERGPKDVTTIQEFQQHCNTAAVIKVLLTNAPLMVWPVDKRTNDTNGHLVATRTVRRGMQTMWKIL